jgi:hypothetical protein
LKSCGMNLRFVDEVLHFSKLTLPRQETKAFL